ncbi:MAG: biopolymer transporter ExbD [Verrucomicrobiales bacterium]|nr:biopolymer transporter ExbD [Verrucomicrobiales bacterium]
MKFRDSQAQQPAELELAPMIDVVFLLLIFFIVSWQFARFERDEEVEVPVAEETDKNARKAGEIIVNIRSDGGIFLNGNQISSTDLLVKLRNLAESYPNQAVILRGDGTADFEHVITVLDQVKEAGIWNVAFATTRKTTQQ